MKHESESSRPNEQHSPPQSPVCGRRDTGVNRLRSVGNKDEENDLENGRGDNRGERNWKTCGYLVLPKEIMTGCGTSAQEKWETQAQRADSRPM